MDSTYRGAEVPARGPPLHQFSPPLPEDHTNVFEAPRSVEETSGRIRESRMHAIVPPLHRLIYGDLGFLSPPDVLVPRYNRAQKHIREWYQEMYPSINLPLGVLRDPNMQLVVAYRLQFITDIRNPTFTSDLVRDKNGSPIKVAIYDTSTQSIISADNFLSSAKVRIIVLDAEFWKNRVHWSRGEFDQNLLGGREGKGPILTGRSCIIQLENGVGIFENIVFNDNSSWTRSGFRLGVMVEGDGEEGYLNGERVQEGVSEPFQVKDRRGKVSQKPKLLKLTHGVKCIKKIGKDRASLLQKKKINTVNDFLKSYYHDKAELREILGIKSESSKEWDSMIEHAMQCENEFHAKYNALINSSQPPETSVHPMEVNSSLSTNDGRSVVGCGSSQQNPSDEDLNEFLNSWCDLDLQGLVHI